eukprot:5363759-Amphidinium_carterae.1
MSGEFLRFLADKRFTHLSSNTSHVASARWERWATTQRESFLMMCLRFQGSWLRKFPFSRFNMQLLKTVAPDTVPTTMITVFHQHVLLQSSHQRHPKYPLHTNEELNPSLTGMCCNVTSALLAATRPWRQQWRRAAWSCAETLSTQRHKECAQSGAGMCFNMTYAMLNITH